MCDDGGFDMHNTIRTKANEFKARRTNHYTTETLSRFIMSNMSSGGKQAMLRRSYKSYHGHRGLHYIRKLKEDHECTKHFLQKQLKKKAKTTQE